MKPPPDMTITVHPPEDDHDHVPVTVTVEAPYCPCGWRCHAATHPCSLACTAHHPVAEDTDEAT